MFWAKLRMQCYTDLPVIKAVYSCNRCSIESCFLIKALQSMQVLCIHVKPMSTAQAGPDPCYCLVPLTIVKQLSLCAVTHTNKPIGLVFDFNIVSLCIFCSLAEAVQSYNSSFHKKRAPQASMLAPVWNKTENSSTSSGTPASLH